MELNLKKLENTIVIYPQGRLDVHLTEEIEKEISLLIADETSSHLLLNLREVEYMSSSGVALFVSTMNTLQQRGKQFALCDLNSSVRKILDLVEMTTLFKIFNTENEACEFLLTK